MIDPTIFGVFGGLLGNILFLPQIIKGLRTKSTKDLSWWTYILITFNALFWTTFGVLSAQPVIYIANTISTLLALFMLGLKSRYG